MREIKFRAWDKNGWDRGWINDIYAGEDINYESDEYIIEQFTGLKDKNGREIYEGDIVRGGCVILWSEEKALFAEFFVDGENKRIASYPFDSKYSEVIGNIHENQELLK